MTLPISHQHHQTGAENQILRHSQETRCWEGVQWAQGWPAQG